MTLSIPEDILDPQIMCLDNNPKRANLISASSLPAIAFQKCKYVGVFFLRNSESWEKP